MDSILAIAQLLLLAAAWRIAIIVPDRLKEIQTTLDAIADRE